MQNLQKKPMVTVKDAAAALGFDERTIREKLASGEWKGEKVLVGMKEKWFLYHGEFQRQVERLRALRGERTTMDGIEEVFTVEASAVEVDSDAPESIDEDIHAEAAAERPPQGQHTDFVEKFWSQISEKFLDRIETKDQLIGELQSELSEKDRQLKLLPDLQAMAETERKARSEKEFELEALKKQVEALKRDKENELASLRLELECLQLKQQAPQASWWQKFFLGKN